MKSRKCSTCGEIKQMTEFTTNSYRCKPCAAEYQRGYRIAHKDRVNTESRRNKNRLRQRNIRRTRHDKIIERLGNRCVKCGFTDKWALQIDHIHGGGKKDVKRFKSTNAYYNHILNISDEDLFKKYQCLCANCNWIKRRENKELYIK